MNLLKSLYQRKYITIFFTIAFTVAIITFSIGTSAMTAQKKKAKEFSSENNKFISFLETENISLDEIKNIIEKEEVMLIVEGFDDTLGIGIETRVIGSGVDFKIDIKDGEEFKKSDFLSDENIGLFSSRLSEEEFNMNSLDTDENIPIQKIGSFYSLERKIMIPYKVFNEIFKNKSFSNGALTLIIRGESESLDIVISKIDTYVKEKNLNSKIAAYPYIVDNKSVEAEALYGVTFLILCITIINSITISSLWVKTRKKEIVLRKVFGAENNDIAKIFFGEITIIALTSCLSALLIQYIISVFTGGYISTIDVRLNLSNFILSSILAIGTSFLITIPSLKYISKIQPIEMLRGE